MQKSRKVLIAAGIVAIFVAVVIAISYMLYSPQMAIINKQLAAIHDSDPALAYSYTTQEFKNATTLTEFEDFINHYPALKNADVEFNRTEINGDVASVKGLIKTDNGATPIEFLLAQEGKDWRIMGIQLNSAETDTSNADEGKQSTATPGALTKKYDNQDSRYTMSYPATWEYEKSGDGTIIFSGKRGSPAYFSTVNIQTVLTKKSGGDFSTVKQFMADIKLQAKTQSPDVKFLESGPIDLGEKSGIKEKGEYTVFTYRYKDQEFKQWQIVVLRDDGQVFYAWAYTAPIKQYPDSEDIAKAMLDTWVIY